MKTLCQLFTLLLFVYCFGKQIILVSTLTLSGLGNKQSSGMLFGKYDPICDPYKDLSYRQRVLCRKDIYLMGSVIDGAKLGIQECKRLFHNERWNCPDYTKDTTALGLMTNTATREAAFHNAIVAAGIVHVVARNCMKGDLTHCKCSTAGRPKSLAAKYLWGGCGDNIQYGNTHSKSFLNDRRLLTINGSTDNKLAAKLLMDEHNNEVGRQAVVRNKQIVCKCIGATFQCPVKTCWYQVQDFKLIGEFLKRKYDTAMKAKLFKKDNGKKVVLRVNQNDISNRKHDLIYTETSPDYCDKKLNMNHVPGTIGRQCDSKKTGPGSCSHLCCGRGYKTESRVVTKTCFCKFVFCCEVKCQTCKKAIKVTVCR